MFGILTIIFDVLEEIIGKIIESRYIAICPIIDKIIDIGRRVPQIIGDFRELSAKLSISKITEELSKIYRYRKKWLIAHPYESYFWCSPNPDLKIHTNPVLNQKPKICSWLWKAVKICLISNIQYCCGYFGCTLWNNIKFELFRHCLKFWLWAVWVDYRLQNCAIFAAAAASCCALP